MKNVVTLHLTVESKSFKQPLFTDKTSNKDSNDRYIQRENHANMPAKY